MTDLSKLSDRELLELAAEAAGIKIEYVPEHGCFWIAMGQGLPINPWDSLKDAGDALRLAVVLKLHILHNDQSDAVPWVSAVLNKTMAHGAAEFSDEAERMTATCRAITLAAAAIALEKRGKQ